MLKIYKNEDNSHKKLFFLPQYFWTHLIWAHHHYKISHTNIINKAIDAEMYNDDGYLFASGSHISFYDKKTSKFILTEHILRKKSPQLSTVTYYYFTYIVLNNNKKVHAPFNLKSTQKIHLM